MRSAAAGKRKKRKTRRKRKERAETGGNGWRRGSTLPGSLAPRETWAEES